MPHTLSFPLSLSFFLSFSFIALTLHECPTPPFFVPHFSLSPSSVPSHLVSSCPSSHCALLSPCSVESFLARFAGDASQPPWETRPRKRSGSLAIHRLQATPAVFLPVPGDPKIPVPLTPSRAKLSLRTLYLTITSYLVQNLKEAKKRTQN